jgi:hypothetical protein
MVINELCYVDCKQEIIKPYKIPNITEINSESAGGFRGRLFSRQACEAAKQITADKGDKIYGYYYPNVE